MTIIRIFFLTAFMTLSLQAQDTFTPIDKDAPLVTEESLPPELQNEKFYVEFFKMLLILAVVIAALMAVMWFVRRMASVRMTQMNRSSLLQIVETRPLSPKTTLYIMDVEGKRLIFAESHEGVTFLAETQPSRDENS